MWKERVVAYSKVISNQENNKNKEASIGAKIRNLDLPNKRQFQPLNHYVFCVIICGIHFLF
jgi:hypothetical protein